MYHKAWTGNAWQANWESLGGTFKSMPVAVAWGPNRLDVFGLGTDNAMYHKAWTGSVLAGRVGEPRGCVQSAPRQSWPQAREPTRRLRPGHQQRHMYHKAWTGAAWQANWEDLGGVFNSPPAVAAWGANRLDIFGLGTDNAMYHKAWTGAAWQANWEDLGGVFDSPPAVAAWGANRLDVFGLGTDNAMYHKAWTGAAWQANWEDLGGVFDSPPAVVAWGPSRLDVFGLGTNDAMYHKAWTGAAWRGRVGGPQWCVQHCPGGGDLGRQPAGPLRSRDRLCHVSQGVDGSRLAGRVGEPGRRIHSEYREGTDRGPWEQLQLSY